MQNPKRKLFDHVVDEVDGVGLGVAAIDLERAYAGGVVDGRVLVAPHRPALFPLQSQELDVHLDAVTGNSLFVSVGVNRPAAHSIGEPVQTVPLAHAVHGCVRGLDVVVALQVPNDANGSHVIRATQIQDLLNDLPGGLVGGGCGGSRTSDSSAPHRRIHGTDPARDKRLISRSRSAGRQS